MFRSVALATLSLSIATVAYGDVVPVAGASTGVFSAPTTGTAVANTWTFGSGANESSIVFGGLPFAGTTPLTFNLGTLTLSNGGNGGLSPDTYTALLQITAAFTTPLGQNAIFDDTISLMVVNGSPEKKVAVSSVPGPKTFTTGGETYTVTFNGMFDAAIGGNDITSDPGLTVDNPGSGSADSTVGTAWLRATVTAGPASGGTDTSPVPEPGSLGLLLSAVGGIGFALYRKRTV